MWVPKMNKPSRILPTALNFLLFALLYILHYCGVFSIKIIGANPLSPLALLVATCMFCSEGTAAFAGLLLGIFMDAVSADSSFLYTLTFFICAVAVSLTVHYLFNNNIRSAIMLCVICCVFVYLARWLCFYCFGKNLSESIEYLLHYALPSVIYTALFIIPFYFLERRICRKLNQYREMR